MDKISTLAYMLFQFDDEKIKEIAIGLLNGDFIMRELKRIRHIRPYLVIAESKLNEEYNQSDVVDFVGEYLMADM